MIPTIETICEDLKAGKITVQQAIAWLYQHAEGADNERRDDFAAFALQGFLAAHSGVQVPMPPADQAADWAYQYADAMLKAREA